MKLDTHRQGDFFVLGACFLWGLFPVITILSYQSIPPLISFAVSNFLAAVFFALLLTRKKLWYTLKNKIALKYILLVTLIIAIGVHLLYFIALQFTSAGNTSIVAQTEFLFSFLIFHVFKGEKLPKLQIIGAVLMLLGALIILMPNATTLNIGDVFILIASFLAPIGNFYSQKARKLVSSEAIMFVRSILSAVVIFFIALLINTKIEVLTIQNSIIFLLINGFVILGMSKIWWIEGIHRISIPKANALGSITPLFTLLFAWLFLNQHPTAWQLISFFPIAAGILLLSKKTTTDEILP